MDSSGFAQSRGDDDLFDDELIPIAPTEVQTITQQFQETSIQPEPPKEPANRGIRTRGGPNKIRGVGRGRGRGAGSGAPPPGKTPANDGAESTADSPSTEQAPETATQEATIEPEHQPARPQAVRGDRTATGGVKKPKLTEEELTAKMSEAKARASALSEAHARAQADADSFEERERIAKQKRKVVAARDAANRQVMDTEREANRRRKMQAQGIREWDMEKDEDEISGRGRGRGYMRGAHGGVRYDKKPESRNELEFDETTAPSERGRGGRGRGRGRGRGGGLENGQASKGLAGSKYAQPDFTNKDSEFPALPPNLKSTTQVPEKTKRPTPTGRKASENLGGSGEPGTWADQVESSVAAE